TEITAKKNKFFIFKILLLRIEYTFKEINYFIHLFLSLKVYSTLFIKQKLSNENFLVTKQIFKEL
ncbi:MAG: hypothetical protein RI945_398, partial [Candidatus Parcubacteria bacterium]